ncbi:helix-turn-helix transcriptional regulator [Staphylococcus equorum]|uniref:helix-turn-helix transcriptional regulator n=1 Tax=Staphylococcus equorum TaxID=246432 RepID=UPI002980DD13|nr:helix-turn-helix transcriptional regulator [Staphylococcus equorum]MDW5472304.1 helix-turn-helix transcriptional regulator [Staphylococcus equorum]
MITKKSELKGKYLKPKKMLREERLKRELSASYVANVIGIDRRQYGLKEKGFYPFHDYEISVICKALDIDKEVFFI